MRSPTTHRLSLYPHTDTERMCAPRTQIRYFQTGLSAVTRIQTKLVYFDARSSNVLIEQQIKLCLQLQL